MSSLSIVTTPIRGTLVGVRKNLFEFREEAQTRIYEERKTIWVCLGLVLTAWSLQVIYGPEVAGFFLFIVAAGAGLQNDGPQTTSNILAAFPNAHWIFPTLLFSLTLVGTHYWGWTKDGGDLFGTAGADLAFGKLDRIPLPAEFTWRQMIGPPLLIVCSALGIQVSNTVLMQTAFTEKSVLMDILLKSGKGWIVGFVIALAFWAIKRRLTSKPVHTEASEREKNLWYWVQYYVWSGTLGIGAAVLFHFWLRNDTSQTTIFLPREISPQMFPWTMLVFVVGLAILMKYRNGKIETIVEACPGFDKDADPLHRIRELVFTISILIIVLMVMDGRYHVSMSSSFVSLGIIAGRLLALIDAEPGLTREFAWAKIRKDNLKAIGGMILAVVLNADKFLK